ncbi:hypothetical protein [Achromobacter pestifer]|uniref:Capsule polysaccharide biosynthesis protein n=1 Tax=Achromobacter pestifer TaxID=1353889 RepID=A0A6S6YPC9_9BURK|nr:hypothetical protein [Achromobacter pestifer]CAB3626854.1 hypothetical protein LMG3431_00410 [Achromobacter pestifer]
MIIFSDKANFKRDNFPALFDFLDGHSIEYGYDESNDDLKKAWGVYDYARFSQEHRAIAESDVGSYLGVDLHECLKDEIFSRYALHNDWSLSKKQSESELLEFLKEYFPDEFRNCRAVACFWIDYWDQLFSKLKPVAAMSFGGNLIYSKIFLAVAKKRAVPGFVLEHFFTGHDFYLEPRYSSLPNSSFLRSKKFTEALNIKRSTPDSEVWKKIYSQSNKNVSQPAFTSCKLRNYALVLAQVPNDFSIFSKTNKWKNSIGFYKEVISEILDFTEDPVVIKVHPYERMKNKGASISTFDAIKDYREQLTHAKRERLHIVEDYSLSGLISGCKYAVTLNSQSGLEVAGHAKPLICFGGAFYGDRGFTIDLTEISQIREVVPNLKFSEELLRSYSKFLSAAFSHLVGSGEVEKVRLIFSNINLRKRKIGGAAPAKLGNASGPIVLAKPQSSLTPSVAPKVASKGGNSGAMQKGATDRQGKLWKKFKKDPRGYCLDSKHAVLRFIGRKIL